MSSGKPVVAYDSAGSARGLVYGFWALALLFAGAAFWPHPGLWGFNHLAYLPRLGVGAWALSALLLLAPPTQTLLARWLGTLMIRARAGRGLFCLAVLVAASLVFRALSPVTHFLGDGYLIGELIEKGLPFRAFDNMDYQLHFQAYRLLKASTLQSAFQLYRITSIAAGCGTVLLMWRLLARFDWSPWRKLLFFGLYLTGGNIALFCGYVESYSLLALCSLGFLLTALLALDGKLPLWAPASWWGLGVFWHLTGVVTLPALLALGWLAPAAAGRRRWLDLLGPPVVLVAVSATVHWALGFDRAWLAREFFPDQTLSGLVVPLTGPWGLASLQNLSQQFNLLLIGFPVVLVLVMGHLPRLRTCLRDPRLRFLVVFILMTGLASLLIDRKLGAARDWDLLAAHGAGWLAFGVLLVPDGRFSDRGSGRPPRWVVLGLTVSLLITSPWLLAVRMPSVAIHRLQAVSQGFQPHARAYFFESLGQYHRDRGDLLKALDMYRQCAAAAPGNARFHKLLGSTYLALVGEGVVSAQEQAAYLAHAEESFRRAVTLDPSLVTVKDNLARLLIRRGAYQEAGLWLKEVVAADPGGVTALSALGYCQLELGECESAVRLMTRSLELDPDLKVRRYLGRALACLGRYVDAEAAFMEGLRSGESGPQARLYYAATLVDWVDRDRRDGVEITPDRLARVRNDIEVLLEGATYAAQRDTLMERLAKGAGDGESDPTRPSQSPH